MSYADVTFHSVQLTAGDFKSDEAVSKQYVDSSVSVAIDALVAGAPAAMDTLSELATQISSGSTAAAAITSSLSALQTQVSQEIASRAAGDASLQSSLQTELSIRTQADTVINGTLLQHSVLIQNETNSRVGSVAGLQASVGQVNTAIQSEIGDRQASDLAIQGILNVDRSAALLRDGALGNRVTEETAARELSDGQLQASLQTERDERQNDVTALSTSKLDQSPYYFGGSESHFAISEGAYLYIGNHWRIAASTSGQARRLVFEYNELTADSPWSVAVPFIRPSAH